MAVADGNKFIGWSGRSCLLQRNSKIPSVTQKFQLRHRSRLRQKQHKYKQDGIFHDAFEMTEIQSLELQRSGFAQWLRAVASRSGFAQWLRAVASRSCAACEPRSSRQTILIDLGLFAWFYKALASCRPPRTRKPSNRGKESTRKLPAADVGSMISLLILASRSRDKPPPCAVHFEDDNFYDVSMHCVATKFPHISSLLYIYLLSKRVIVLSYSSNNVKTSNSSSIRSNGGGGGLSRLLKARISRFLEARIDAHSSPHGPTAGAEKVEKFSRETTDDYEDFVFAAGAEEISQMKRDLQNFLKNLCPADIDRLEGCDLKRLLEYRWDHGLSDEALFRINEEYSHRKNPRQKRTSKQATDTVIESRYYKLALYCQIDNIRKELENCAKSTTGVPFRTMALREGIKQTGDPELEGDSFTLGILEASHEALDHQRIRHNIHGKKVLDEPHLEEYGIAAKDRVPDSRKCVKALQHIGSADYMWAWNQSPRSRVGEQAEETDLDRAYQPDQEQDTKTEQEDSELIAKAEQLFRKQVTESDPDHTGVRYILPYRHAGVWHCLFRSSEFTCVIYVTESRKIKAVNKDLQTDKVSRKLSDASTLQTNLIYQLC
ncbi:hypothetical protein KCU95_g74, partial [Aureobasidium melanogenum]